MSEKVKPLPCPNPECSTENPRVHFTILSGYEVYFIECQNDKCCHHGPPKHDEQEAITAWNSIPRALVWTAEPPTEPGHYWCRYTGSDKATWTPAYIPAVGDLRPYDMEKHERIEWAGPIPMPKEPEA